MRRDDGDGERAGAPKEAASHELKLTQRPQRDHPAAVRVPRHAPLRRLEPRDAAERGGDADGAAAVGADGKGADARGDEAGAAAAGVGWGVGV
jgi:hypothetical protein